MPTFSNDPLPRVDTPTPSSLPETEPAPQPPVEKAPPASSAFHAPAFDGVSVQHFRVAPASAVAKLNVDLGLSLDSYRFARLQSFFRDVIKRDPTVGELRLLDGLDRPDRGSPDRLAVGELITQSDAVAATWSEMMALHGELHGVGRSLRGARALPAPPCTLTEALSLTGHTRARTEADPPTSEGGLPVSSGAVLLSHPRQEAVAAAEGYTPVARIALEGEQRSLWLRKAPAPEALPGRTGDFILYIPRLSPQRVAALGSRLQEGRVPLGSLCAVATKPLLLTLLELCPSINLYADRLATSRHPIRSGHLPVELLCAPPAVDRDGTADHLLRVPLKQLRNVTALLKELSMAAVICGQALTGERTVIRIRNATGKEDIPVVQLPTEFLRATAAVYLHSYTVPRQTVPPAVPTPPAMTRLPSPHVKEDGITPDGREAVVLTLHEGRVLSLPEASILLCAASATPTDVKNSFATAAEAVIAATDPLSELGISPSAMTLSVSITVSDASLLTDSRLQAVICGINRGALDRSLPVEDPVIAVSPDNAPDLRLTVVAWAQDKALCTELSLPADRQWRMSGSPVHKESPLYCLPLLRPSCEDSLKALSAALNRHHGVGCALHPVPVTTEEAEGTPPRTIIPREAAERLAEALKGWAMPIFALPEADTRLLLAEPAIRDALKRRAEYGYPILVLGDSCIPFAECGLLPAALTELTTVSDTAPIATVTYRFPADSAARLLRCPPLTPSRLSASAEPHLLTLHTDNGTALPDGFIGQNGRVLGLLNGLDTTLLPLVEKGRFDL